MGKHLLMARPGRHSPPIDPPTGRLGPTLKLNPPAEQMIWEQKVSVVVMLTRLNENGTPMSHCYWPTNIQTQVAPGSEPPAEVAPEAPTQRAGSPAANQRRGSVTSVFSAAACLRPAPNGGQPIIANGDLSDNVLAFDVPSWPRSLSASDSSIEEDSAGEPSSAPRSSSSSSKASPPAAATIRLEVHLISEHVSSSDFLVRNLYLINRATGETRTISQFHYLAWPDGRTPASVRSFLQFRRKVHKSYRSLKSPILVHCSDGAGRSGTYTLIDIILERIRNGAKEIDARATLEHLRDQRVGLCANQSQFEFVLVALAEEIQIILNALPQ